MPVRPALVGPAAALASRASWQMIGVTVLFAGGFVGSKYTVGYLPPFTAAALRFAIAGAVMLLVLPPAQRVLPRPGQRLLMATIGLLGVFTYNLAFFYGLQFSTASAGALLIPTSVPLLTGLLANVLLGEALTLRHLGGIGLGTAGLAFLLASDSGASAAAPDPLLGNVCFLASALSWSLYSVASKRAMAHYSPLTVATYANVVGASLLVLVALGERPWAYLAAAPAAVWAAVLYLALGATVLAFLWYNRGVAQLGAGKAASHLYLVPFNTVLLAALLLGERVSAGQLAGGALILCGVFLINTGGRVGRRPAVPSPEPSPEGRHAR